MSVLFTDPDDGKHKLYIKGADSIIEARLSKNRNDKTLDFITDFLARSSVKGFRNLLLAIKVFDDDEFESIMAEIEEAESDILNSDKLLQDIFDRYETDLTLLGSTAVEDRLQDDVPDTLEDFRIAGIKVWMLTGDKLETARNIGFSCKLLTDDMIIYRAKGKEEAAKEFNEERVKDNEDLMREMRKRAIIMDADALSFLCLHPNNLKCFIIIAKSCDAVICSRVSPAQKAEVVRMIKRDDTQNITLSIGDGANDVSMILEAHIGIGIYGKEGVRAAQASDFAIHKFKYLWQLVLYHGRYNYIRISELILYFFYKNLIFTIFQLYFAFISDYSAQSYFDDWYISFYNLFFTALPIGARALWEMDINYKWYKDPHTSEEVKSLYPHLYYVGQRSLIFTKLNYFIWAGSGLSQALLIFLVNYFTFKYAIIMESGRTIGHWAISITSFTAVIIIVNIRILVTHRWLNVLNLIAIFLLSMGLYYLYHWVANFMTYSKTYMTSQVLHESPLFYLSILLNVGICLLIDLAIETVRVNLLGRPTAFARIEVNNHGAIRDETYNHFMYLVRNKDKKYMHKDIQREKYIQQQRDIRMQKMERRIASKQQELNRQST